MQHPLLRSGSELFAAFDVVPESEVVFADLTSDMIWCHGGGIRFTQDALLISDLKRDQDDWTQAGTVDFYPWYNVHSIRNVQGVTVLREFELPEIAAWLESQDWPSVSYPHLHASRAQLALVIEGVPRSARSKGGKARLRTDIEAQRRTIAARFGGPLEGPVELAIDVFSSSPEALPDVDRFSLSIMDALKGLTYEDDKQVRDLRPRVHDVTSAFQQLECTTEPMIHYSVDDVPPSVLYPLSSGIRDYYVVRVQAND